MTINIKYAAFLFASLFAVTGCAKKIANVSTVDLVSGRATTATFTKARQFTLSPSHPYVYNAYLMVYFNSQDEKQKISNSISRKDCSGKAGCGSIDFSLQVISASKNRVVVSEKVSVMDFTGESDNYLYKKLSEIVLDPDSYRVEITPIGRYPAFLSQVELEIR